MRFKIPLWAKVLVSIALLVFVFTKVDLGSFFKSIARSNPYLLAAATLLAFASWMLNTYKWQILLAGPGTHLSYWQLLRLNFIAMFYNMVLPGQVGGEIIKGINLSRMGVSGSVSAVSVVADRVTGLFAIFVLGLAGALLAPDAIRPQIYLLPWLIGISFALAVASVMLVTGRGPSLVISAGRSIHWPQSRYTRTIGGYLQRFSMPKRSWSTLFQPFLLSAAFQLITVYINLLVVQALGLQVSYLQLLWIVAIVSLLQSLPISIAGIGVREGAYVYLLHQQGVAEASALAVSLIVFGIQVLMAMSGGLFQLSAHLVGQQD